LPRCAVPRLGREFPSFPPFIIDKLQMGMSDDSEIQCLTRMDDAFCARMRAAIARGLESAPIGFITTPGTQSPKYVPPDGRQPPHPAIRTFS
jgi:hypothetical protein